MATRLRHIYADEFPTIAESQHCRQLAGSHKVANTSFNTATRNYFYLDAFPRYDQVRMAHVNGAIDGLPGNGTM